MKQRGFEQVTGYDEAIIPVRGTSGSAGYDFCSYEEVTIEPNQTVMVKTGIKAYMLDDEVLQIYPRSSLGVKKHLRLANSVGIIDSDYYNNENNEGHIMIPLFNFGQELVVIAKGERVAQGIFSKYLITDTDQVSAKRSGGFGSTNESN